MPRQKINKNRFEKSVFFFFSLFFGLFLTGLKPIHAAPPAGYNLVWSDEFDQGIGSKADPSVWNYNLSTDGNGNNELENYMDDTRSGSIHVDLQATDDRVFAITAAPGGRAYTSAKIDTHGHKSFQYGYFEARIQIPYGQGIWPAFWLVGDQGPWPSCGEIDIMENIGKVSDQGTCHGSMHGPGYSAGQCLTGKYILPNGELFKDGYHLFAVLWEKDFVQFYCDGHPYETRTPADLPHGAAWVYNHPFFIILNLAVGGNWPGSPDATTIFPQVMKVDYVRVYQKAPAMDSGTTISPAAITTASPTVSVARP